MMDKTKSSSEAQDKPCQALSPVAEYYALPSRH